MPQSFKNFAPKRVGLLPHLQVPGGGLWTQAPKTVQILHTVWAVQIRKSVFVLSSSGKQIRWRNQSIKDGSRDFNCKNLRNGKFGTQTKSSRKPLHSPESILRRSKASDDFPCEQCDYRASSKTVLKRHVTMKHKETSKPSLSLPPVPCFRNFYGCHNLVTEYKTENTAICPTCKKMLAEKEISNPFSPNLCPCCHESCSGPPFTFCGECLSGLKADNLIDSRWGAWQLETETGDIICIDLDFT